MTFRTCMAVGLVAILVGLGGWAVASQSKLVEPPMVFSGSDFGFRVERIERGVPTGRFVIRLGQEWVEVQVGIGSLPLQ